MTDGINCSFCGKLPSEVFRIVTGPTCNICSECVGRCANMIAEELRESAAEILILRPLPPESQGGEG